MSSLTGLIYSLEAAMAPLEAGMVFGIELGENFTMALASARLLMLGTVSSPKIIFLFFFCNIYGWPRGSGRWGRGGVSPVRCMASCGHARAAQAVSGEK